MTVVTTHVAVRIDEPVVTNPAGGTIDEPVTILDVGTIGFIRVRKRKRKLKQTRALSYDLVKAVRVTGGTPSHVFVCGFGTLRDDSDRIFEFWSAAFDKMRQHGFDEQERHHIAKMMIAKGARLPTPVKLIPARTVGGWTFPAMHITPSDPDMRWLFQNPTMRT
jgi:hypothetical protein